MRRVSRPLGLAMTVGVCVGVATPTIAFADAAGPTDYRSEIVEVTPAEAAGVIDVAIEGGDAFVSIDVAPGHEVVVFGYDDEPYLRIDEAGVVFENRRSFATYYNEDRYGDVDIPDVVDNDAAAEWARIAGDGSWAWHDHRAHWMGTEPPIGLEPGDSLPTQVVPMSVDGTPVEIEVSTTLIAPPSRWPALFGLMMGLAIVLAASLAGPATVDLVAIVLSAFAVWVGVAQFRSLPAETGPLVTWWLLPATALACCLAVIAIYGRSRLVEAGLLAVAGLQLLLWAVRRRSGLSSALLPTDLPFWLDRAVTAAALSGGAVVAVVAVRAMLVRPVTSRG